MKNFYSLLFAMSIMLFAASNITAQDITGTAFEDVNGNGIDDDAAPLAGINVDLLDAFGTPTGITAVTDGAGFYTLTGAVPGTDYQIQFGAPGTMVSTTPNAGPPNDSKVAQPSNIIPTFTMTAVDLTDQNGGFYTVVEVGGTLFLDENGNGLDDEGSVALPVGVDVTLLKDDGTGTFVIATDFMGGPLVNPANSTSGFLFQNLAPGTYRLNFGTDATLGRTQWNVTGSAAQPDATDDNDADPATGDSHDFVLASGDPYYDEAEAGYWTAMNISGIVWLDDDGDGSDNEGGAALPGNVNVTLFDINAGGPALNDFQGNPLPANPINTNNLYAFNNIPPGDYRIIFEEPGGGGAGNLNITYQHETGDGGADIADAADDSDADRVTGESHDIALTIPSLDRTEVDAGYWVPVQVGDFVFEDIVANGDWTDGDGGLDIAVDITLIKLTGNLTADDVDGNPLVLPINQGAGGIYDFGPLPPGEYEVNFAWVEPDVFPTFPDSAPETDDSDIDDTPGVGNATTTRTTGLLTSGMQDLDLDAGFFKPATIEDFVWEDLNYDGQQAGGEPGIDGVNILLLDGGGAPVNFADGLPGTTVSAGGGAYQLTPLRPGDYIVQFDLPAPAPDPYYYTIPNFAGENTSANPGRSDSDADPATGGQTFVVTVISDQTQSDIDCGMIRAARIGDYTWHDLNGDGIQDAAEPPLGGVTVSIRDVNTGMAPIDLVTMAPKPDQISDGAGFYEFRDIPPGTYELTFTAPAPDWFTTRQMQGGDPTLDSDPDQMTGVTGQIMLESGQEDLDIDAGFFRAAQIGSFVWHDENADGVRDVAETLDIPPGVTITVIDLTTGGPALDFMGNPAVVVVPVTGDWLFDLGNGNAILPGMYQLEIGGLPGGWNLSDQDVGPDTDDSDFDPATFRTATFTLVSEEIDYDYGAGIWSGITAGGRLFGDLDGDCMYTAGVDGDIAGITVIIRNTVDGMEFSTTSAMDGTYCFMDLKPGDYIIEIPPFTGTGLANNQSCGPAVDPNTYVEGDNNIDAPTNGPGVTPVIELRCGREGPNGDGVVDKSIDFGFEFDCGATGNNPFANMGCQEAADNPVCDLRVLETGCATMWDLNPTPPANLCGGAQSHNMSWFSFFGGYGNYDVFIEIFGCSLGQGVQAGLYEYDPELGDCIGGNRVFCNEGANPPPGFLVTNPMWIPGQQYVMWLDGFNNDICGYGIEIQGNYVPFEIPRLEEILCDGNPMCDEVCPGVTMNFEAIAGLNPIGEITPYEDVKNLLFRWSLRDAVTNGVIADWNSNPDDFEVLDPMLSYTFNDVGSFLICLDEITHPCPNLNLFPDECLEINVIELDDEDFGFIEICEGDLFNYQGPQSVDEAGVDFDPNLDGTTGWVFQGPLNYGFNLQEVNDNGCIYEQTVEIEEIFNSDPYQLDTAVCGPLGFPIFVLDAEFNNEITGFVVRGEDMAVNGCDTAVSVNIYELNLEGEIEFIGCAPGGGFLIQFEEEFIRNTRPFPLEYQWYDSNGDTIPDDGDGDPYTITVPSNGDYSFEVIINTDFDFPTVNVSCPYVFDYTLDAGDLAPETPRPENWDLEYCDYDATSTFTIEVDDPSEIEEYIWTYPTDAILISGQNTDSLVLDWSNSAGGVVCVAVRNECGIGLPTCDTITIVPRPIAAVAVGDSVCIDSIDQVFFPGTQDPTFTYGWNFGGGNPVGTTNIPGPIDVSWPTAGIKTVSLNITKSGCVSDVADTTILVVEPVTPPLITCTSTQTEIVFTWNDIPGQTGFDPSITNGPGTGMLSGNTFTITGLTNGDVVDIELITNTTSPCGPVTSLGSCTAQNCPPNAVTVEPVDPICLDANTTSFDLTPILQSAIGGEYLWSGPGITDAVAGTFDPTTANIGPNTILVEFTDDNDCVYNGSINIRVSPTPTADFDMPGVVCQDSVVEVQYTGTATGGLYTWDFGDVTAPGNGAGPFDLQWQTPGQKQVTLTVEEGGCESEPFDLPITVEPRIEPLDVDCDGDLTNILISWGALDNVTNFDLYVDNVLILDNTGDLTYDVRNLTTNQIIDIRIEAFSDNSCPGVIWEGQCEAISCPPADILITPQDSTLCLNADALPFTLDANVVGGPMIGGGMGVWSGPGIVNAATGEFDPSVAGISTGAGHRITYTYMEAGCEYEESIRISIIEQPTADITAPPVICITDPLIVTYEGSSPLLPFEWNIEGNGTQVAAGVNTFEITWPSAGTYDVGLTVGDGGCISDPFVIEVQVDPEMEVVDITCTSTLSSVTFNWEDIDCAGEYEVTIDNILQGTQNDLTYEVTGLNEGDEVEITVLPIEECACPATPTVFRCTAQACPPIVLTLTTPIDQICQDDATQDIQLSAAIAGSVTTGQGTWSGNGISADGVWNPNGYAPGLYEFTFSYTETDCDFSESISIEILEEPTVDITSVDPDCYQDNFGNATLAGVGGTGTNYTITVDNNANFDLTAIAPGTYNVELTDEAGCTDQGSFTITGAAQPSFELLGATSVNVGDSTTIRFNVGSGVSADSIVWTLNGQPLCANCTEVRFGPSEEQEVPDVICATYWFNDECIVDDCIEIRAIKSDVILVPDIIYVGSNNNNDKFKLFPYETVQLIQHLSIYDRWGNKMYLVENVDKNSDYGWSGTMNGVDVEQGVYVYRLDLLMTNGEVLKLSGDVTVLRQ